MVEVMPWAVLDNVMDVLMNNPNKIVAMSQKFEIKDSGYDVNNGIAVIPIKGVLTKEMSWYSFLSGSTGSYLSYTKDIQNALTDDSVSGILLDMSTPGGSVEGAFDLADFIFSANKKKPIYSYISDCGCSAGYLLASQTTKIFCNSNALVGSIGCYTTISDSSKLYEDNGIKVHLIASSTTKGGGAPGVQVSEEVISATQEQINSFHNLFTKTVLRGRQLSDKQQEKVFNASVYVGQQAVSCGLVDKCVNMDSVMKSIGSTTKSKTKIETVIEPLMAEEELTIVAETVVITTEQETELDQVTYDQKLFEDFGVTANEIKSTLTFMSGYRDNIISETKRNYIAAFGSDTSINFTSLDVASIMEMNKDYIKIKDEKFGTARLTESNRDVNVDDKVKKMSDAKTNLIGLEGYSL